MSWHMDRTEWDEDIAAIKRGDQDAEKRLWDAYQYAISENRVASVLHRKEFACLQYHGGKDVSDDIRWTLEVVLDGRSNIFSNKTLDGVIDYACNHLEGLSDAKQRAKEG